MKKKTNIYECTDASVIRKFFNRMAIFLSKLPDIIKIPDKLNILPINVYII